MRAACRLNIMRHVARARGSHLEGLPGHTAQVCVWTDMCPGSSSPLSVEHHSRGRPVPISSPSQQTRASIYQSQVLAQASDTLGLHLSSRSYVMSVKAVFY